MLAAIERRAVMRRVVELGREKRANTEHRDENRPARAVKRERRSVKRDDRERIDADLRKRLRTEHITFGDRHHAATAVAKIGTELREMTPQH